MDYTEKLRALRVDNDETQAELAIAIGIPQNQYSRYEVGANELPIRYLVKICQHYRISSDYLLGLPRGLRWPR